jgi:hypothetical protein
MIDAVLGPVVHDRLISTGKVAHSGRSTVTRPPIRADLSVKILVIMSYGARISRISAPWLMVNGSLGEVDGRRGDFMSI